MMKKQVTEADKQAVRDWKNAAIQDGWTCQPLNSDSRWKERWVKLQRDGFVVQVMTRDPVEGDLMRQSTEYDIAAWGPDGLALDVPYPYDWAAMQRNLLLCSECKRFVEKTVRVAFANRTCEKCAPALRAQMEKPGWYN